MARVLPLISWGGLTSRRMLLLFVVVLLVFVAAVIAVNSISDEKERENTAILTGIIPLAVLIFLWGFVSWGNYNTIVNTPTSRPGGVAAGFVEVYGEVAPKGEYLKSPFGEEECAFYRYRISEIKGMGLYLNGDSGNFLVKDQTGVVEVDPYGAEFGMSGWRTFHVKGREKIPSTISRFIDELRKDYWWSPSSILFEGKDMMYQEYAIKKGEKVFVTGTAVPWYDLSSGRYVPKIIIRKGKDNGFFYISKKNEKDILRDVRNEVILFIIGGGLATIAGVGYILLKLKY